MASHNTFDNDMDSFLNIPQDDFTPASTSPNTHVPQLASQSSHFGNSQTFAGPSFQYDAYRQQTGLPVGALANTFAINQNAGLQHYDGQGGFVMPTDSINLPLSKIEDFDFNNMGDMGDMDFDAESPADLSSMFYPRGSPSQFVSPTTLVSNTSPSGSAPIQRIYPGMHSQAAQAKAQQAAKQQEMNRQQPPQQQSRPAPAGQKPLPKGQPAKDPRVEESISRILNQMRQKSIAGSDEDGTAAPSISNMPRSRKDEEDMDEDERLLASEEGKKLSSKERRQLRNKVSARAFRSRRKEYIGQLEGEVAAKVDEANSLRTENEQLREENNRLTDLTRMLLSSQAFSGFLQELSQTGVPPPAQPRPTQQTQQERPQPQRKDVNPHTAARQMQSRQPSQIGMALIPETNVDLSLFDTPSWNTGASSNDFQVFAVTELPEPVLDVTKISEKSEKPVVSKSQSAKLRPCIPQVSRTIRVEAPTTSKPTATVSSSTPFSPITAPSLSPKASAITAATSVETLDEQNSLKQLNTWCAELEETSNRLAAFLPGPE